MTQKTGQPWLRMEFLQSRLNEKEKPVDYNNHAMDALRYFAKSLLGAKPKATVSQSKPVASNKFDWNRFNQDRVTRMTRK